MRLLALALLALLAGCKPDRVTTTSSGLALGATRVQFPATIVGRHERAQLELRNTGKSDRTVKLTVLAPFSVDPVTFALPGGTSLQAELTFSPEALGDFSQV